MFNMFKHEDSVIFDPIWCSVIGSDISKSTGAPKKRFLEEYERDLCMRTSINPCSDCRFFMTM